MPNEASVKLTQLEVAKITLDERCQQRELFDKERVADAVEFLADGGVFRDPIVVYLDGKTYWLSEGFTRTRAYIEREVKVCVADVRKGTLRDAVVNSCGSNTHPQQKREPADVKKAVKRLLDVDNWGRMTDAQIAAACKVKLSRVQRIKDEIIEEAAPAGESGEGEARQGRLWALKVAEKETLAIMAPYIDKARIDFAEHDGLAWFESWAQKGLDKMGEAMAEEAR